MKALLKKGLYLLTEEGKRKLFFSSEQEIIQLLYTHIYTEQHVAHLAWATKKIHEITAIFIKLLTPVEALSL